jgi:hypothetical protein
MNDHGDLINRMAEALRSLSDAMLDSGTARWGAYERAGLINLDDCRHPDTHRINAHLDGIIHTGVDRAAVETEKLRRQIISDAPCAALVR